MFSVIMPLYNTDSRFLSKAIESVLNQTYSDFEFIIVCDKPTDKCDSIAKEYAKKDKRIIILENLSNVGVAKTLNVAIRNSKGEYLIRMDADDVCSNDRLECLSKYIEKHPDVDVLFSNCDYIDEHDRKLRFKNNNPCNRSIKTSLLIGCLLTHPTAAMKKSALSKYDCVYNPNRKSEDYDLWTRLIIDNKRMEIINKKLYSYRLHSNQITNYNSCAITQDAFDVQKRYIMNYVDITEEEFKAFVLVMTKKDYYSKEDLTLTKMVIKRIISTKQFSSTYLYKRLFFSRIRRIFNK